MKRTLLRRVLTVALCFALITQTQTSKAESLKAVGDEIVIGIVVASAAIVVGIILIVRHEASYKGCVSSSAEGLEFTSGDTPITYDLSGDVAGLHPGELVRLKGKKKSARHNGGRALLIVSKVGRDYGACPAHP